MAEISQEELNERVAILRRFRSLLEQQRNKFKEYLDILEKQQDSISDKNPESLMAHTELEQQVVKNIENLQKVIVPMSKMYNSVKATSASEENMSESKNEDEQINLIQNELFSLQSKVLEQNKLNRELLKVKLDQVKTQINNFKNPYKNLHSVYAQKQSVATLVQIEV